MTIDHPDESRDHRDAAREQARHYAGSPQRDSRRSSPESDAATSSDSGRDKNRRQGQRIRPAFPPSLHSATSDDADPIVAFDHHSESSIVNSQSDTATDADDAFVEFESSTSERQAEERGRAGRSTSRHDLSGANDDDLPNRPFHDAVEEAEARDAAGPRPTRRRSKYEPEDGSSRHEPLPDPAAAKHRLEELNDDDPDQVYTLAEDEHDLHAGRSHVTEMNAEGVGSGGLEVDPSLHHSRGQASPHHRQLLPNNELVSSRLGRRSHSGRPYAEEEDELFCAACGYDLYNLDDDACPECGAELTEDTVRGHVERGEQVRSFLGDEWVWIKWVCIGTAVCTILILGLQIYEASAGSTHQIASRVMGLICLFVGAGCAYAAVSDLPHDNDDAFLTGGLTVFGIAFFTALFVFLANGLVM
ncbi:MAG: hypothetical protein ACOC0P_05640 [Planctomycetota bacterium]